MCRHGYSHLAAGIAGLALVALSFAPAQGDALSDLKAKLRQQIHTSSGSGAPPFNADVALQGGTETFHNGKHLHCSDCHVMHASDQGETFGGAGNNPTGYLHLLRRSTSLDLCLMCHDGVTNIPDVVGADTNGLADRCGGQFAAPSTVNTNGHTLGTGAIDLCSRCHFRSSSSPPPDVTCVDCHNPHGNGRPRNLQWASYPEGTPPLGLFIDPAATGMQRYEASHVAYGTDGTSNLREVTNICIDCHHVFSGSSYTSSDVSGGFHKHPVQESERGADIPISMGDSARTSDSAHWVSGSGTGFDVPRVRFCADPATDYSTARTVSTQNRVFCLSCHKAHGSTNRSGVVWPPNAEGSYGPSGCDQCHNKAR